MNELEQAFYAEMLNIYEEARKEGYQPSSFRAMVERHGGVEAARRLSQGTTEGFQRLVELGRLDLTSEALMLKPEYAPLFSDAERVHARERLAALGYRAPWDDGAEDEEVQGGAGRGIPDASRDDLLAALDRFDAEQRESDEWRGWEARASHRYAIEYEGRRYPVKQIISFATGAPRDSFSGGNQANGYARARGFDVVRLRPELDRAETSPLPPEMPLYKAEALATLIAEFEAQWSSFESEAYLDMERRYKVRAFEQTREELGRERLEALMREGNWEEAKRAIQRAVGRTNLLNQWDTTPIRSAPTEPLVRRLWALLYGEGPFDDRLDEWIALIREGSERAWPAATYFLMVFDPDDQIFVKATPFRGLFKRLESPLQWESRPTAARYAPLRALAQALLEALRPLGARDMIDVQSFIWLMTRKDDSATAELDDEEPTPEAAPPATRHPGGIAHGTWIFQGNPKYYDLAAALDGLKEMSWIAPQHQNEIQEGDTAYLWESGASGGIVAVATVTEAARERGDDEASRPFYRGTSGDLQAVQPRVWLRINRVLDGRIGRDELRDHPVLRHLSIFRNAQGTNLPVTTEQAEALAALVAGKAGAETRDEEADGVEIAEAEVEAREGHSRYIVESPEEWRRAVDSKNPVIRRAAEELPQWVEERFGERVTARMSIHPGRPWIYLRAPDGRILAGFELNRVRTIYVWVAELSESQEGELRATLATPGSLRARPAYGSDAAWRFTIQTAEDYELALKIVGEMVDRLVSAANEEDADEGTEVEGETADLTEPELEAGTRGRHMVESADEWRRSVGSTNPLIQRAARELPTWLSDRYGQRVNMLLNRNPSRPWLYLRSWDGRWLAGFELNWVRTIYVWVHDLSDPQRAELRAKLSTSNSLRARPRLGSDTGWRFTLSTEADYELALKVVSETADRLVMRPGVWPERFDRPAFVVIHAEDNEYQRYGESYSFTNFAGGAHRQLSDAVEAWQRGGPAVHLITYRPAPDIAFTGWGRVIGVEERPGENANQRRWTLRLEFHEFPVTLGLKGNAAALNGRLPWLAKGLGVAFWGFSIRSLPPTEFATIIEAAKRAAGESEMDAVEAAYDILYHAGGGSRTLDELLSAAREQGLIRETPGQLEFANGLRSDGRFSDLGGGRWMLREVVSSAPPLGRRLPDAWSDLGSYIELARTLGAETISADTLLAAADELAPFDASPLDGDALAMQLRQLRLMVADSDGYRVANYVSGDQRALRRLVALALLVPSDDGSFQRPARGIADLIESAAGDQALDSFAPELGEENATLLRWYNEAGLVELDGERWRPAPDALTLLDGDDVATTMLNNFLTALRDTAAGAAEDLPEIEQRPLRGLTEDERHARMQELTRDLLIEESIVRRIYRSLLVGRHVVLSGPPGTGKTELARRLPTLFWREEPQSFLRLTAEPDSPPVEVHEERREGYLPIVVTATEDWGVRDVVGGIAPRLDETDGKLVYSIQFGALTRTLLLHYEGTDGGRRLPTNGNAPTRQDVWHEGRRYRGAWLVIDEFTRAPVDAAFGSLLTTLSGGDEARLAVPSGDFRDIQLPLPPDFRIIGTLNSFDRHFLNQMSEALKRRFDFIDVPPPPPSLRRAEEGIAVRKALARWQAAASMGWSRGRRVHCAGRMCSLLRSWRGRAAASSMSALTQRTRNARSVASSGSSS